MKGKRGLYFGIVKPETYNTPGVGKKTFTVLDLTILSRWDGVHQDPESIDSHSTLTLRNSRYHV